MCQPGVLLNSRKNNSENLFSGKTKKSDELTLGLLKKIAVTRLFSFTRFCHPKINIFLLFRGLKSEFDELQNFSSQILCGKFSLSFINFGR
jgi:hypothetical protein